jgi:hypothetical protein
MRVQASIQFSCATTGRNLETQLNTETRNLVMFRRGKVPMRCAFCGQQHYWRLIEYRRPVAKHQPRHAPGTLHAGENYLEPAEQFAPIGVRVRSMRCDTIPRSPSTK